MRTVIPILCVGTVVPSRPVDITVPLVIDREERLVVSVTIPWADRPTSSMTLFMRDESFLINRAAIPADLVELLFTDSRNSSSVFRVEDERMTFFTETSGTGSSGLGIGTGGAITQLAGSVAIYKDENRAQLVVGSSFEDFNSSCFPNSLMSFNMADFERLPESAIRLDDVDMGTYRIRFITLQNQSGRGYRAEVPMDVFNRVVDMITDTGAVRVPVRNSRIWNFSDCTIDTFETLPVVEIGLGQNRILLFPEDYLELDVSDGTCKMRITIVTRSYVYVNLLMLVDTNVRINDNHLIYICDSNGDF